MDGEAGWWTTSGNIGLLPLVRVMGVGRQQQQTLGNADPSDYVRFVLKSNDFDRPLNNSYQSRSQVSGAWLSELAGKLLQSHESLDLDNNLTLHVQHVDIPRGNGRARIAANMWTNILLQRCVLTNVAQHNHIPCFGYALVLAINRLFTDLTGTHYHAANENRMINEVSACFKTSGIHYGPVGCTQYHLFLPCLPPNSRLIVVDAKDRTNKLLYKSYVVNANDSHVNNVCLLLFNNHYYPLTSLPAWYGQNCYCIECEVRYTSKHTCKPVRLCSTCSEKNCLPLPTFTRCCKKCFALFLIVPVSEITWKTVYMTIQSHVTHVASGSSVQCLNTYVIYHIAVIVQNLSNQINSVLLR